jgi:farnesyl-diphosphate farnesyltransferase
VTVETTTDRLSDAQHQYIAEKMNKVSRSFALVVPEVESPLADYLAVAYLICRVVDNIEDTQQPFSWQKKRYAEFAGLLDAPYLADRVLAGWESCNWPGLSDDERRMMTREHGLMLWDIYAQMPHTACESIKRWTSTMAEGMARSSDPNAGDFFRERNGVRLPATYLDYNKYCFYVAGTVGRMISDLAAESYGINGAAAKKLARDSECCGRALQKTNIIKDFAKDLARGVSYLPEEWLREIDYSPLHLAGAPAFWKRKVLLDVVAELDGSANFVMALPQSAVGLRKASLLMMMPAYETILLAAQQLPHLFTPEHAVKISRPTLGQCVRRARKIAIDNTAVRNYAKEISANIEQTLATQASSTDWLR